MMIQMTKLKKCLGTLIKWKWVLHNMGSSMHLKMIRSRKLFKTLITNKKFISTVASFALLQITSMRKWIWTQITKCFHSTMVSNLLFQITSIRKWLGTFMQGFYFYLLTITIKGFPPIWIPTVLAKFYTKFLPSKNEHHIFLAKYFYRKTQLKLDS